MKTSVDKLPVWVEELDMIFPPGTHQYMIFVSHTPVSGGFASRVLAPLPQYQLDNESLLFIDTVRTIGDENGTDKSESKRKKNRRDRRRDRIDGYS